MSYDFKIRNHVLVKYHGNGGAVTIPDRVTTIGKSAFSGCENLTSVTIPDSVTSIGGKAFSDTPWLENYPDDFVIGGKVLIEYKGNDEAVTIPDSVTSIGDSAFQECSSLTSVTIPDSVTSTCNLIEEVEFTKILQMKYADRLAT